MTNKSAPCHHCGMRPRLYLDGRLMNHMTPLGLCFGSGEKPLTRLPRGHLRHWCPRCTKHIRITGRGKLHIHNQPVNGPAYEAELCPGGGHPGFEDREKILAQQPS